jgi:hypothetical protein
MSEELFDLGVGDIQPVFHPTSIYDHTIYQAWSEVIMSLIPPFVLGEYDNLINFMHLVRATMPMHRPFQASHKLPTLEFKHKIRLFVRLKSMLAYFSQSRVARGYDFQPELRIS